MKKNPASYHVLGIKSKNMSPGMRQCVAINWAPPGNLPSPSPARFATRSGGDCPEKPDEHPQGASRPSGHVHGSAIVGYPTRDIPRLIENIGDHRRWPLMPGKPRAMQLDPAKSIPCQVRRGP